MHTFIWRFVSWRLKCPPWKKMWIFIFMPWGEHYPYTYFVEFFLRGRPLRIGYDHVLENVFTIISLHIHIWRNIRGISCMFWGLHEENIFGGALEANVAPWILNLPSFMETYLSLVYFGFIWLYNWFDHPLFCWKCYIVCNGKLIQSTF